MNWVFTVAAIAVAVAVVLRLLWWAFGRPHWLAGQHRTSAENPTELSEAAHVAEETNKK